MSLRFSKPMLGMLLFLGTAFAAGETIAAGNDDLPATSGAPKNFSGSVEYAPPAASDPAPAKDMGPEATSSDVPPPSRAIFTDADCNYDGWVGEKVDEPAVESMGRPYRILAPGAMMTMDHNPKRINVEHDKKMIVTRVWCG